MWSLYTGGYSLYAGSITWKVYPWGPVKCFYKQVVFRSGLNVHVTVHWPRSVIFNFGCDDFESSVGVWGTFKFHLTVPCAAWPAQPSISCTGKGSKTHMDTSGCSSIITNTGLGLKLAFYYYAFIM